MFRLALILGSAALVTACASNPNSPRDVAYNERQYCYTSQEIVTKDGEQVSSKTVVKCSDSPEENPRTFLNESRIADKCGHYKTHMTLHNKDFYGRGVACYIEETGTWEIVY